MLHTWNEWEALAAAGDKTAVRVISVGAVQAERTRQRRPLSFSQAQMDDRFVSAYQALADLLQCTVHATGSSIRGYWRTSQEEDEIAKRFGVEPKYSDFDFWTDPPMLKAEAERLANTLNPIAPFQYTRWERSVPFYPQEKVK